MITRPEGEPLGGVLVTREIQITRVRLARVESRGPLRHRGHPRERRSLPKGVRKNETKRECAREK